MYRFDQPLPVPAPDGTSSGAIFAVSMVRVDECVLLTVVGDVDLAVRDSFADGLRRAVAHREDVAVDLRHVTFMDSTGVELLVHAALDAAVHRRCVHVRGVATPVRRVLALTGVAPLLGLDPATDGLPQRVRPHDPDDGRRPDGGPALTA